MLAEASEKLVQTLNNRWLARRFIVNSEVTRKSNNNCYYNGTNFDILIHQNKYMRLFVLNAVRNIIIKSH